MAVKGSHIHIVDGKQVSYPDGNCPICGTAKPAGEREKFIPKSYRKGQTVVLMPSRFRVGTDTYWGEGKCILHTLKQAVRQQGGGLARDSEGKLIWNSVTFRLSLELAKQYITELSKLIQDVEGAGSVPTRE